MNFHVALCCFREFWESAKKPLGRHACAGTSALTQFCVVVFELLGGKFNPPGGAGCMTLF